MENLQKSERSILDDLYRELGMVDFLYIETHQYVEELQIKREELIKQIKEYHGTDQSLHSIT